MSEEKQAVLSDELAELAGFLVVSARGLMQEPAHYGPFRLIDAASRLVAVLERNGLATPRLLELRERIEASEAAGMGPEEFTGFLDELVMWLVEEE